MRFLVEVSLSSLAIVVFVRPFVVALDVALVPVFLVFFGGGATSTSSAELPFATEAPTQVTLVVAFVPVRVELRVERVVEAP